MSSERQANQERSPWWGEHVQRYHVVEQQLGPSDSVLDIACGSGYGTARLAERTRGLVVGGDVSESAIGRCRETWARRPNLEFRVLDGTRLDFPDASFDKVVSFETIEHTREFEKMVSELRRVLKPGGTIFLSTPNIEINSPGRVVTNPYHTQEFDFGEFTGLVNRHFGSPRFFGQKYVRYASARGAGAALARCAETTFYRRGIRKLPLSLQDAVMRTLIGKPQYPEPEDFTLVAEEEEIRKCKTFVAICRKA